MRLPPEGTSPRPASAHFAAADLRHQRRRDRELATIRVMIRMYCADHHAGPSPCPDCTELAGYAARRIERCVFGAAKPTCANCKVHCYGVEMRERVKTVMRYAGPRMLVRHPVLAIAHVIDGRRPAPELPAKSQARTLR